MEDTEVDPKVRAALRAWREGRGMTVRQAASLAGISPSHWSDLETGEAKPDKAPGHATAKALEALTGIDADRWLRREERERIERLKLFERAHRPTTEGTEPPAPVTP